MYFHAPCFQQLTLSYLLIEVLALLDSFAMTYPDREVLDSNPPDGTRQRAALRETEPEARDLSVKEFASEMIAFILNKASRRQVRF